MCCSLRPIWDPRDRSSYEVVSVSSYSSALLPNLEPVGLFQSHIFFPNGIVDCVFLGSSSGTTVLSLTHVQGKSHPSVESRWAQRRWSCLPSENSGPMVAMAMARCPPWIVTPQTLCEKRGEGWAQSGKLSPSPLNCCILGSLSS